jgi:hypothetical protein
MLTYRSLSVLYPDQDMLIQSPKPQTLYELVKQGTNLVFPLKRSAVSPLRRQLIRSPTFDLARSVTDEIPDDNALGYLPVISAKDERPLRFAEEYSWIKYGEVEQTRMEVSFTSFISTRFSFLDEFGYAGREQEQG